MNRTERHYWLKKMDEEGRYHKVVRVLVKGEREDDIRHELIQSHLGKTIWYHTWNWYPKFGNPQVHFGYVTADLKGEE